MYQNNYDQRKKLCAIVYILYTPHLTNLQKKETDLYCQKTNHQLFLVRSTEKNALPWGRRTLRDNLNAFLLDCGCGLMVKWVTIIKSSILNRFTYFTEGYYILEKVLFKKNPQAYSLDIQNLYCVMTLFFILISVLVTWVYALSEFPKLYTQVYAFYYKQVSFNE